MSRIIAPGATLGVLGGGQLGRMFVQAAHSMGYRVHVFAPEEFSPAGDVADAHTRASYMDSDALVRFAREVEVVTFEFENVPAEAVDAVERHAPVRPSRALLHAAQNRSREKNALRKLGQPVTTFAEIRSDSDLDAALELVGLPAILKTAASGYDGKGQARIERAEELGEAWRSLGSPHSVLEAVVPFTVELSIIGARGLDGSIALFEPVWNQHTDHILDLTLCPAPVPSGTIAAAEEIARAVLEGFEVVGVLCVELFLLADGGLLVNELAPRPHNSGHLTIDAHVTSQFEEQVRAVCGLPLGSTERSVPAAAMANLLGDLWEKGEPAWDAALAMKDVHLHLYGKREARPKRKMGHLTVSAPDVASAERLALAARKALVSGR